MPSPVPSIRRFRRRLTVAALPLLLPAALAAQQVAELYAAPENLRLATGASQALSVTMFDAQGNPLTDVPVTWRSLDTTVAAVNGVGLVRALRAGSTRVEVAAGGKRALVPVTVRGTAPGPRPTEPAAPVPAARPVLIALDPPALDLLPGEQRRVAALGTHEDGTPAGLGPLAWRTLQPGVAQVDSTGRVTALNPGTTMVIAATETSTGSAQVRVTRADVGVQPTRLVLPVGWRDTLVAIVPAQGDRPLGEGFAWRSLDATVARVTTAGEVEGVSPGATELVLDGRDVELRVPVRVHLAPAALEVSPRQGTYRLPVGADAEVQAVAVAAGGEAVAEVAVQWSLSDSAVARYDRATRRLTALAAGTTTLAATAPGLPTARWEIEVVPAGVAVRPGRLALRPGARDTLVARMTDGKGTDLGAVEEPRWASAAPAVAVVSPRGEVTALAVGRAEITATAPWERAGSAAVFVVADVAIVSNRGGRLAARQYLVETPDALLPLVEDSTVCQLALSPDRTRLAYTALVDGQPQLFVADADGGNRRQLTTGPAAAKDPAWLPDGSAIVHGSEQGVIGQVMLQPLDGAARPLTTGAGINGQPAVSPDGRRVAFVATAGSRSDVYETSLDGTGLRQLTFTQDRERAPRYLPGGDLIVAADRSGGGQVLRLVPGQATQPPVVLARTEAPVTALDVSRDGREVLFATGRLARGRAEYRLWRLAPEPGAVPAPLQLAPGEQLVALAWLR